MNGYLPASCISTYWDPAEALAFPPAVGMFHAQVAVSGIRVISVGDTAPGKCPRSPGGRPDKISAGNGRRFKAVIPDLDGGRTHQLEGALGDDRGPAVALRSADDHGSVVDREAAAEGVGAADRDHAAPAMVMPPLPGIRATADGLPAGRGGEGQVRTAGEVDRATEG